MNRTGLFVALSLALVVGLLFGIYPELDLKLAALFYDPATKSFPLKLNRGRRDHARRRDVARLGDGVAGARQRWRQIRAAGPAAVDVGARDHFPAAHPDAVGGGLHQSRLQELLGPPAPRGGDAIQWTRGICAVVGSARHLRAQLLVLLRRGRHRVLDLCARGVDAAGLAAASPISAPPCSAWSPACSGWRSADIFSPTSRPPGWSRSC